MCTLKRASVCASDCLFDFVKMLNNSYNGIGDDLTHVGDGKSVVVSVVVCCAGEGKLVGEESLRKFTQGKESTLVYVPRSGCSRSRINITCWR